MTSAANCRVMLLLVLCSSVTSLDDGWKQVCQQHCKDKGDPMVHNIKVRACDSYKHMLPKPRVFNICNTAFQKMISETCITVCDGGSHSTGHAEVKSNQICKKQKRAVPKPAMYNCCMEGAAAGSEAAHKYASFLIETYAYKLEHEKEMSKEEIIKEMMLEADIEESAMLKIKPGEEVVVEEIRAEAEAEVKEIIEEVKQGKTDLDLAREAARAAFKAKQEAEEAEGEAVEEIDL